MSKPPQVLAWQADVDVGLPQDSDLDERIQDSLKRTSTSKQHMLLDDRRPGPCTAVECVQWPPFALNSLSEQGKKFFGEDFTKVARDRLYQGLSLTTDYSGIGCPEEALDHLLTAFYAKDAMHGEPVPQMPHFKNLRAGDLDQHCQEVLRMRSGPFSPECVFGDLMDRCPTPCRVRLEQALESACRNRDRKVSNGLTKTEAFHLVGKRFIMQAWQVTQAYGAKEAAALKSYCHVHGGQCPVLPESNSPGSSMHIAGVSCTDWSSMGGKAGWLGKTALPFLQWLRERVLGGEQIVLVECVPTFDAETLKEMVKEQYHLELLIFSPTLFGQPTERQRAYMILLRKDSFHWHPAISDYGIQAAFERIYARTSLLLGEALFRAPKAVLDEFMQEQIHKQRMPLSSRSGKAWSPFQVSSRSVRDSIASHEKALTNRIGSDGKRAEWICNLQQKADFMQATHFRIPAILRQTHLWLFGRKRWALPIEYLEVQGYNIFGADADGSEDGDNHGHLYKCRITETLKALPSRVLKSVAGNGMHLQAVGSVILFVLGCVQKPSMVEGQES